MFEKFMTNNAGDFRQRYKGTYGFFHRDGLSTLVRLDSVDLERRKVGFVDIKGNDYYAVMNHDDNIGFSFIAPKAQWHNTGAGPLLVQRVPQKQYRRGICDNNTQLLTLDGANAGVNFPNLHSIFVDPKKVADVCKDERFAVSPQFAVDLAKKRLKCNNFVIGTAGKDSKQVFHVKLDDPDLFRQEVGDAFRRANLEVNFK